MPLHKGLQRARSWRAAKNSHSSNDEEDFDQVIPFVDPGNEPQLILSIAILQARNLKHRGSGRLRNSFVAFTLNDFSFSTRAVPKSLNPEWNAAFEVPFSNYLDNAVISGVVWDRYRIRKHWLGSFELPLSCIFNSENLPSDDNTIKSIWIPIKSHNHKNSNGSGGDVKIKLSILDTKGRHTLSNHDIVKHLEMSKLTSSPAPLLETDHYTKDGNHLLTTPYSAGDDTLSDSMVSSGGSASRSRLKLSSISNLNLSKVYKGRNYGLKRRRPRDFEFAQTGKDKLQGLIFFEVVSISDLPPERNLTRTGFDMDPFVIVSFGKNVYRTRVYRHCLNPVFNEKMVFKVRQHELSYSLHLTVMDRDKLSSNDLVAMADVKIQPLIQNGPQPDPKTGLFNMSLPESQVSTFIKTTSPSHTPFRFHKKKKKSDNKSHSPVKTNDGSRSNSPIRNPTPSLDTQTKHTDSPIPGRLSKPPVILLPPSQYSKERDRAFYSSPEEQDDDDDDDDKSSIGDASTTGNRSDDEMSLEEIIDRHPDDSDAHLQVPTENHSSSKDNEDEEKNLSELVLPLKLKHAALWESKHSPTVKLRARYIPYSAIRQQFWRYMLRIYDANGDDRIDMLEFVSMLDALGSTLKPQTIESIFAGQKGEEPNKEITIDKAISSLDRLVEKSATPRESHANPNKKNQASSSSSPSSPSSSSSSSYDSLADIKTSDVGAIGQDEEDSAHSRKKVEALTETLVSPDRIPTDPTEFLEDFPFGPDSETEDAVDWDMEDSDFRDGDDSDTEEEERVIKINVCPVCHQPRLGKRSEADILIHIATCLSSDWRNVDRLVVRKYVSPMQARRKWYTNTVGIIMSGRYKLGANSANILVQDRKTGQIMEESMNLYVRLGIRWIYQGITSRELTKKRTKALLESLSKKQGRKYDSPHSARLIRSFIKFHKLDMSQVLEPIENFHTFNQFFYRKLKPDARPCASPDNPNIIVSPADCRAVVFDKLELATKFWIKGKGFTVSRLLGPHYGKEQDKFSGGAIAVFRLAPQDYHRFHMPVDGVLDEPKVIKGTYYTVNPMAVRSVLDVFGENVRVVCPVDSRQFGRVMVVCVGAMMVGSTIITAKKGQQLNRTDELGYFQFGGSTLVVLFEKGKIQFDSDLVENSMSSLETLLCVGMAIGKKVDTATASAVGSTSS